MRAITVKQPWAWAISHGGKTVENRTTNIAGAFRGRFAIHAGKEWDDVGAHDRRVGVAYLAALKAHGWRPMDGEYAFLAEFEKVGLPREVIPADAFGAVVATATLTDVHAAKGVAYQGIGRWQEVIACCNNQWGNLHHEHLVLADVRPLEQPVPARGFLGLWTLPDDVAAAVESSLS